MTLTKATRAVTAAILVAATFVAMPLTASAMTDPVYVPKVGFIGHVDSAPQNTEVKYTKDLTQGPGR